MDGWMGWREGTYALHASERAVGWCGRTGGGFDTLGGAFGEGFGAGSSRVVMDDDDDDD